MKIPFSLDDNCIVLYFSQLLKALLKFSLSVFSILLNDSISKIVSLLKSSIYFIFLQKYNFYFSTIISKYV